MINEREHRERFRDEASTHLFRVALPIAQDTYEAQLAVLLFFSRYDVDIRHGRARLERSEG